MKGFLRMLGRVLALLLPLLLLLGYGVKLWRKVAPWFASERALPRVVYRAQLDRLSGLALRRRYGESREAFATRIAKSSPSFAQLTALHVAARFGRDQAATKEALRALARSVRTELRAGFPRHLRLLGSLHPFSWLASR